MKLEKMKTALFAYFLLCMPFVFAQEIETISQPTVTSAGDNARSPSYTISYTLGETVVDLYGSDNWTISQGFQQTVGLRVVSVRVGSFLSNRIQVYPNPTKDLVFISGYSSDIIRLELIDASGRSILSKTLRLDDVVERINFERFPEGMYVLIIKDIIKKKQNSYKIIKQ